MPENLNQVPCNGTAVLPASLLRQSLRVRRTKVSRGDLWMFMKIPLAAGECLFNIAAEFVLQRIVSSNLGPPEVGFPFLKYRAEIQKDDVILTNR
jgi:hypothetical protein